MKSDRTSIPWRVVLLIGCLIGAGLLFGSLDWRERFATDVSVLLPASEGDDAAAKLLAEVREQEERLILGALMAPEVGWTENRDAAATALLENLRQSGLFTKVAEGAGPSNPDALATAVYEHRLDLLLPQWAESAGGNESLLTAPDADLWAETIITSLEDFLANPAATALGELIPADPFPLAAYMMDSAPVDVSKDDAGPVLFWAIQKASPFKPEGQQPVLDALADAERAAAGAVSGVSLGYASVAAFAVESESRIRQEITLLNSLGIALVVLVAFLFLRRRAMLLHLVVIGGLSVTGGLAAAVIFFPVVHILSLVVGGLLVGIAIDYGIHILLHQPSVQEEGFARTLRDVRKPLLTSGLSTAAGFAALAFAELLLIRQIGVFVAGGLLSALATCWLYFPLWRRPAEIARTGPAKPLAAAAGIPLRLAVAVVFVVPLTGWFFLDWRDDLRELQPPMPERWEADAEVRRLFSQGETFTGWLVPGADGREARSLLAAFEMRWEEADGDRDDLRSLAPWIAAPEKRDALRRLFAEMPEFEEVFMGKLRERGFEAEEFAPFFERLRAWLSNENPGYEENLLAVAATLDGPSGMLLEAGEEGWWFLVSAPDRAVPEGWEAPEGVISTAQLETLNDLFAQYRRAAWRLSGVALLMIAGGVLLIYGPAAGAAGLLIPALAWAWGMGALAGLVSPLNLFHLLGGFLGFCVALDYGLFFRHARATGRGIPLSIRVSAATTLSAFGVLAFGGSIPAVTALGASVFAVVLGGWFLVEMAAGRDLWRRKNHDGAIC